MSTIQTPAEQAKVVGSDTLWQLVYVSSGSLLVICMFAFYGAEPLSHYSVALSLFSLALGIALLGRFFNFATLRFLDNGNIAAANFAMYLGIVAALASIVAFVSGWVFGFS